MLKILLLDTKYGNPNHYLILAIKSALIQNKKVSDVYLVNYREAITLAIDNKCNLFLALGGEKMDLHICERLARICGLSAVWYTEDPYEIEVNLKTSKIFDFVFTNDSSCVPLYKKPTKHLPLAASETFHYRSVSNTYLYDLFFVGTAWPNRIQLISTILTQLPDIKYKIALSFNESIDFLPKGMRKAQFQWRTPTTQFSTFSNKSKITLALHRNFSASGLRNLPTTPGPRIFEVAMAGGFQIADLSLSEINYYYRENEEIVGFHNVEECVSKIKYYLGHSIEREKIAFRAQKKTLELYTYHNRCDDLLEFILSNNKIRNEEKQISRNISNKTRKIILHIVHNTYFHEVYGGTEIYVDILSKSIKNCDALILHPREGNSKLKIYDLINNQGVRIDFFKISKQFSSENICHEEIENQFYNLLIKYKIDIVHFHNFEAFPPVLPYIAKSLGIRTVITIHDFYLLCVEYNLLNYENTYCHPDQISLSICDECLYKKRGLQKNSQYKRRIFFKRLIDVIDMIVFNSESSKNLLQTTFNKSLNLEKVKISAPPVTISVHGSHFSQKLNQDNNYYVPKKVLILGNLSLHKGSEVILNAINKMACDAYEFHIFGFASDTTMKMINKINKKNVTYHGKYTINDLHNLITEMDLSLHLSIWPETYCITLTEVFALGIVPIVSDIGALGERVQHKVNGFKIDPNDTSALIETLEWIQHHPFEFKKIQTHIKKEKFFIEKEKFIDTFQNLYNELLEKFPFSWEGGIADELPASFNKYNYRPFLEKQVWGELLKNIKIQNVNDTMLNKVMSSIEKSLILLSQISYKGVRSFKESGVKKTFKKIVHYLSQKVISGIQK